jgi:hypothetical protein
MWKSFGIRPLGIPKRLEDNIKIDFREIGYKVRRGNETGFGSCPTTKTPLNFNTDLFS